MSLEKLLNDNSIELFQSNPQQIKDKIGIAEKALKAARKIVSLNDPDTDDTAYVVAYNTILQTGYTR